MSNLNLSSPSQREYLSQLAKNIRRAMDALDRGLTHYSGDRSAIESHISLADFAFQNLKKESGLGITPPPPEVQVKAADANLGFTERIGELSDAVRVFWTTQGFRHVEDIVFDPHGAARIVFSFSLDEADEEEARQTEGLLEKGYRFIESDGEPTARLVDCDQNRNLALAAVRARFPHATVLAWRGVGLYQSDLAYLDTLSISVDYSEL